MIKNHKFTDFTGSRVDFVMFASIYKLISQACFLHKTFAFKFFAERIIYDINAAGLPAIKALVARYSFGEVY